MLTTTVRPTSGRAWVAGVDVAAAPARVHQHIGVVPQRNTLDRRLSVGDNLVFHGRYFGMRGAAARAAASRIVIPAVPPALHVHWAVLLTLTPLAALMCASLGLFLGTAMDPRLTMALFAVLITPMMWLGAAVTSQPHLSLLVVYPVLAAVTGLLLWQATRHFTRRVIS
jgi:ABC-2 type transport system ATP-binding protein